MVLRKSVLLFCLFSISFSGKVWAQEVEADSVVKSHVYRNSVYGELLGNGLFGSLNYERVFNFPSGNEKLALRVGGVIIPDGRQGEYLDYILVLPVEFSLIWGKSFWKPEVGLGVSYFENPIYYGGRKEGKDEFLLSVVRAGFRFNKPESPFFGRAGLSLMIFPPDFNGFAPDVLPWPGVSFGYSFGKKKN